MASIINAATSGGLVTTADTSGVLQLQTATTTAVTVDASQNVGIGTASPTAKTHIVATTTPVFIVQSNNVNGGYQEFNNGSTAPLYLGFGQTLITGISTSDAAIRYANNLIFGVNATERLRIDIGGRLLVGLTSANTNGSNFQVSQGVTFPATQSASGDANTLDDYEEGYFTATFTPSTSGTITLSGSYNTLSYTKVGRVVTITGEIVVSSASAPVGTSVSIGGFPFAAGTGTASSTGFSVTDLGTLTARVGRINALNTTADMFITASTIGTNSNFVFGFSYIV
mgnify:CR=1 FL=1|tara:strand:- start:123 stop:974 length:852 start_codon:yes stop_codon:yes gene_type:complete